MHSCLKWVCVQVRKCVHIVKFICVRMLFSECSHAWSECVCKCAILCIQPSSYVYVCVCVCMYNQKRMISCLKWVCVQMCNCVYTIKSTCACVSVYACTTRSECTHAWSRIVCVGAISCIQPTSYVYVCVTRLCMCQCTYVPRRNCTYIQVHVCMYVPVYVCTTICEWTNARKHMRMHTYMHTYIHT